MHIPHHLSSYVPPAAQASAADILTLIAFDDSWSLRGQGLEPAAAAEKPAATAHSLHRFLLLEAGEARLFAQGALHDIAAPVVVNIPIGITFEVELLRGARGAIMTVPVHELPEVMRMSVARPSRLAALFTCTATQDLIALMAKIGAELGGSHVFRTAALRALATLFALTALRETEAAPAPMPAAKRSKYLTRILPEIRAHLHQRLSVQDYARLIGISSIHFNRLCRQLMHCSAHELIENIRFQEACRLLTHSDKSISEIGYQLGFEDPSYFSRAFQRNLHETPSDYRRKRRDNG